MSKPLKEKVSITLDGDVVEAIRQLADADDRAFSSYINKALRRYIAYKDQIDSLEKHTDEATP